MERHDRRPSTPLAAARVQRVRLLIVDRAKMETVRLPDAGDVLLGSGADCTVIIADSSVAPHHALLRIGPPIELVDLGAGPTTLGGTRLTPGQAALLVPGVVVALGAVTIVAQVSGASARLRHLRSHDYFEGRVDDECARVDARGGSFAIARFKLEPGAGARAEAPIGASMRPMDVLATYTPEEYELLLLDVDCTEAQRAIDDIALEIRRAGIHAYAALACYPRDGRTPEALFAVVGDALHAVPRAASEKPPVVAVAAMDRLRPMVERVAASVITVLILGETGVGKEVMARSIHDLSPRAGKPLVSLNCAAVSETLLESELFGYERGAFTGAVQSKAGLLESAHGGTILLDEVGEMSAAVQAKLLRVIEQKEVTRLGALAPRPIDVRFLAATNRDLEDDVAQGSFRSDLYFRLNGFTLLIPPLRERVGEIEALAKAFVAEACSTGGAGCPRLSGEALRALQNYTWPGNIRELKNTMRRAVLLCTGDVIEIAHLPTENMGRTLSLPPRRPAQVDHTPAPVSARSRASVTPAPTSSRPRANDADDERTRILAVLDRCAGNQTKAAVELGISRGTLISRIDKYGIPRPKK